MKFKTFLAILFAIAAIVAVAAVVISKRRIRLASDDEFDLDNYDNAYDELGDFEDCAECALEETEEIVEELAPVIEKTYERAAELTDDVLAGVDDLLEKTADNIREIRRF
ncbi:hypothetical protein FACS1894132_04560 [Clostridia bacterium]|nr:hypothetical protein FACS1894132_04560 [Clostridia bacterium]